MRSDEDTREGLRAEGSNLLMAKLYLQTKDVKTIIDLNPLVAKEQQGKLKNIDFTHVWTDVVGLPMCRIDYIVQKSKNTIDGYDSDQAFYYGMLIRIFKFLAWERRIVCAQLMNLELSFIFSRIILEDNITLQYFLRHPNKLDDYRKSSFKGEKAFEDTIIKNRQKRSCDNPELYEWESGLLQSIHNAYSTAGLTSEDIHTEKMPKSIQILQMAKEVGLETFYTSYRLDCHATHGDWYDITRNFLQERDGKFYPRFEEDYTDIRMLNPILLIVYKSLREFLSMLDGHNISDSIIKEFDQDELIIKQLGQMHQNFISKRSLLYGIDTNE